MQWSWRFFEYGVVISAILNFPCSLVSYDIPLKIVSGLEMPPISGGGGKSKF